MAATDFKTWVAGLAAKVGLIGTETLYLLDGGTSKKTTPQDVANLAPVQSVDGDIGAVDLSSRYAPIANGVTGGDSHDHSGGDGAQIAYAGLSGLPTLGSAAAADTSAFEAAGAISTHAAVTSSVHGISSFGSSLVDDADASVARATLGLGSAATTASTAYATAAQGALADSAMQVGDDAADLGSGAATDGYVFTADGAGGTAWEPAAGGSFSGPVSSTDNALVRFDGTGGNTAKNSMATLSDVGELTVPNTIFIRDVKLISYSSNVLAIALGSSEYYRFHTSGGFRQKSSNYLGWSSGGSDLDPDLLLYRDAANTLALRNGSNAQAYNVYNTYTDSSNYERLTFKWSSNLAEIKTEAAGTGTLRDLSIGSTSGKLGFLGATPVVRQTHVPDANTAHALNATFSDTEVEAALNALGTKLNSVLAALRVFGFLATS